MKNIIYISRVCSSKTFNILMKSGKTIAQPAQKFHTLLIEGLRDNDLKVKCITSTPIPIKDKRYNKSFFERLNNIDYYYSYSSNNCLLNRLFSFIYSFYYTFKLVKKEDCVIVDALDISLSMGGLFASKLRKCTFISLVTDMPDDLSNRKLFVNLSYFIINKSDKYILLTEHMNDKIHAQKDDYVVIEGMVGVCNQIVKSKNSNDKFTKICMYAGALEEKYGVKKMVDDFLSLDVENCYLLVYGYGELQEYIEDLAKKNDNIIFGGLVPNSEIIKKEREVDLLINPRTSTEEFTLYSFPSKNMEYLSSGTPMLCSKLGCIPSEYDKYCYYFDDKTEDGFKNALKTILMKDKNELQKLGLQAQKWVYENKNNVSQSKKIIDILELDD